MYRMALLSFSLVDFACRRNQLNIWMLDELPQWALVHGIACDLPSACLNCTLATPGPQRDRRELRLAGTEQANSSGVEQINSRTSKLESKGSVASECRLNVRAAQSYEPVENAR